MTTTGTSVPVFHGSATPPPSAKAQVESVLLDGESLTQFIEGAVLQTAAFRAEQNAAVERARAALRDAEAGIGLISAEEFLAGMQRRAEAAEQRLRAAVAARRNRETG